MGYIKEKMEPGKGFKIYEAPFAHLDTESGELILFDTPVPTNQVISLKDVKYSFFDGILYIIAKKIKWSRKYYSLFWDSDLYEISENFLKDHIVPDNCLLKNSVKGKGFLFLEKYPLVVDSLKNPNGVWFQKKEEKDFEYCLHPFKLYEK